MPTEIVTGKIVATIGMYRVEEITRGEERWYIAQEQMKNGDWLYMGMSFNGYDEMRNPKITAPVFENVAAVISFIADEMRKTAQAVNGVTMESGGCQSEPMTPTRPARLDVDHVEEIRSLMNGLREAVGDAEQGGLKVMIHFSNNDRYYTNGNLQMSLDVTRDLTKDITFDE